MPKSPPLGGLTPAEAYEAFFVPAMFRPLARLLADVAQPAPGERLLDLAAGTGVVAREFAPLLGATGGIVCADLRPGMVAAGRATPAPDGARIEWVEANAESLPFPDASFDLAACQQGFQFFGDRERAAREVKRVLRDGGRAVIACWQDMERQGFFRDMAAAEERHLRVLGLDTSDLYAPFSFGDADSLAALLREAGFGTVSVTPADITARYDAEDFVRKVEYAYSAVVPEFVADPAKFERFVAGVEADLADLLAAHRRDGKIEFPMRSNVAIATA